MPRTYINDVEVTLNIKAKSLGHLEVEMDKLRAVIASLKKHPEGHELDFSFGSGKLVKKVTKLKVIKE